MLDPTFFDRFAMGFSLAVHILLAVIGIVLPAMIALSEYLGIKYKDNNYLVLSKRLSTVFVIFFAVGTASGMLVAINLLFLWPPFMSLVGQVAILPVFLEVFAFFMESIFIAIYIFSYKIMGNTYKHVAIMVIVSIGAALSAVFITMLNGFMNTPVGFNISAYLSTGAVQITNPLAVFTSPAALIEVPHVVAASYFAGAAIMLAYFAYMYLKDTDDKEKIYHVKAAKLCFAILLVATLASIITGILSIEELYYSQPEKYAAIELNLVPQSYASEVIGGFYQNGTVVYGLAIPDLQSILATGSPSGNVPGLSTYPQDTWPPLIVHDMFDFMVGLGFGIGLFVLLIFAIYILKPLKNIFENRKIQWLFVICGFAAVALLENGWMVDEFGRQPWIIYNVMLVSQAANQSTSIIPLAILIIIVYAVLLPLTLVVVKKVFSKRPLRDEL